VFFPPPILFPAAFGEAVYFWLDLRSVFPPISATPVFSFCATFFPPILLYGGIIYLLLRRFNLFGGKKTEGIAAPPLPPVFFE
jgi:hypothetical protein